MAPWSIKRFEVKPGFKIAVTFADGTSGIADLSPRLTQGPLGDGYDVLCDEKFVGRAYLEHGALTWPGGVDLAPDAMYERIKQTGVSTLQARPKRVAQFS